MTETAHSERRQTLADTQESSDCAILDTVAATATAHGVSRAQVSLAWLRHNPVVVAPLGGREQAVPPRRRRGLARDQAG